MKYEMYKELSPELKEEYEYKIGARRPVISTMFLYLAVLFSGLQLLCGFVAYVVATHPVFLNSQLRVTSLLTSYNEWFAIVVYVLLAMFVLFLFETVIYVFHYQKFLKKAQRYLASKEV